MKSSNSININSLRIMIGFYLEDLSISYFMSFKHVNVKANHPHIKYPDRNPSPSWKIS